MTDAAKGSATRPHRRPAPRGVRDLPGEGERQRLTTLQGLAALSLDAPSSAAYCPEAIVLVPVAAGVGALWLTLPITVGIVLLAVLVVSYAQVIAVHPDGGAYAVVGTELGETVSSLAAASLVVDYVLTVAVSLAAGAGARLSTFPALRGHQLVLCLAGLVLLTAVNWGRTNAACRSPRCSTTEPTPSSAPSPSA